MVTDAPLRIASKGTGYVVLAIPFAVVGLLLLAMTLGSYGCDDPYPKQCLAERDKLDVLLVGLGVFSLYLATVAGAIYARLRPDRRSKMNPILVVSGLLAIAGLFPFMLVYFTAAVSATT
ncbi:MAG: hypothetical protein J0H98_06590 [Solirubrobacterales bacterium]|nr:hypothetical protein [Solirubrobacterales bacterium]